MQLPEVVQWLDLGGRTAIAALLVVLYIRVSDLKKDFATRIGRLEGLLMRPPEPPTTTGAGVQRTPTAPDRST